nr:hypothetical protein [uncultured archaeon]
MAYIVRTQDLELMKKQLLINNRILSKQKSTPVITKTIKGNIKLIKFLELNYYI